MAGESAEDSENEENDEFGIPGGMTPHSENFPNHRREDHTNSMEGQ